MGSFDEVEVAQYGGRIFLLSSIQVFLSEKLL